MAVLKMSACKQHDYRSALMHVMQSCLLSRKGSELSAALQGHTGLMQPILGRSRRPAQSPPAARIHDACKRRQNQRQSASSSNPYTRSQRCGLYTETMSDALL